MPAHRQALLPVGLLLACFVACSDDEPVTGVLPDASVPDGAGGGDAALRNDAAGALDASPGTDGAPQNDGSSADTGAQGEAGVDSGGDGGGPLTADYHVDPVNGLDTNDGRTASSAFKTLCKAKDVATANQVISLADGAYDNASQRPAGWIFSFPCGPSFTVPIRLVAANAGAAVLNVPVTLAQGGEIRGLTLDNQVLDGGGLARAAINATGGTLVIRDLRIANVFCPPNAKAAALVVSGNARVTMFPGAVTNYTTVPVPNTTAFVFAFVNAPAELTLEGGTIDDSAAGNADSYCAPLFEGSGTLNLKGVTVRHKGSIVRASGLTLKVTGGTLNDQTTANNTGCVPAIELGNDVNVTMNGTAIGGSQRHAFATFSSGSGTLSLTGVTVSGFTLEAFDLFSNPGAPLAFSMRGSTVQGNNVGIHVAGAVTTDLGTLASPGGNTIAGNTTRGLEVQSTATVNAAGNVWNANQQGAGADGRYAASLQSGPTTGVNYSLGASQKIQF